MRNLFCLSIGLAAIASLMLLRASDDPKRKTYIYKKVGDLEIKADVYQYDDDKLRPIVVWIHGGALINGHQSVTMADELKKHGVKHELISVEGGAFSDNDG